MNNRCIVYNFIIFLWIIYVYFFPLLFLQKNFIFDSNTLHTGYHMWKKNKLIILSIGHTKWSQQSKNFNTSNKIPLNCIYPYMGWFGIHIITFLWYLWICRSYSSNIHTSDNSQGYIKNEIIFLKFSVLGSNIGIWTIVNHRS